MLRAEIGPDSVIELQVSATRVIKCLHRLAIRFCEILEKQTEIRINIFRNGVPAAAKVKHRRRRDRHFWRRMRDLALLFQKFEVIEHGMVVWEIELAYHPHGIVPGLNACKLDSRVGVKQFATRQPREKIEVPPRSPELTIGREL